MPATLNDLIQLVPPPAVPKNIPTPEEWERYEVTLGTPFPSDYKQIINTYGIGWFADWILIASPQNIVNSLQPGTSFLEGSFKSWKNPYLLYPKAGGLLLCGNDDGNSYYTWQTNGLSDTWIIINFPYRTYEDSEAILNYTWLELLVGWFSGEIKNPRRGQGNQWYPEDIHPKKTRFFKQR